MRLTLGLLLILLAVCVAGRHQEYAVKGRLVCRSDELKARNVEVELYDDDAGNEDDMSQGRTDPDGSFSLVGRARDIFDGRIDPVVKIWHFCGVHSHTQQFRRICRRTWKFGLPKRYIDKGDPIDVGDLVLDVHLPEEEIPDACLKTTSNNRRRRA